MALAKAAGGRRLLAAAAALATTLLAAAGCGDKEPGQAPGGGPSGIQGIGSSPTATAAPPAPPPAVPPANTYPKTARAYAQAVLGAWKDGELGYLGELTTPQVHEQIIEIPGPPNQAWTYSRCEGAAGSTYCVYWNATGDEITLRISNQLVGKAHATTEVKFDALSYPDDGEQYVKKFITAWQFGNTARMQALAKPEVVASVTQGQPPANPSYASVGGGGDPQIVAVTASGGFNLELHVGTALLGMPDAIVGTG